MACGQNGQGSGSGVADSGTGGSRSNAENARGGSSQGTYGDGRSGAPSAGAASPGKTGGAGGTAQPGVAGSGNDAQPNATSADAGDAATERDASPGASDASGRSGDGGPGDSLDGGSTDTTTPPEAGAGSPGPELATDAGVDQTECTGGLLGHPIDGYQYPTRDGFTLCLVEEFAQPLDLVNDPIWTYSDGSLFEGNVRHVKDGLSFVDGKMNITVQEQTAPASWSWAAWSYIPDKPLTSGELRTKFNNFRYGRYEVSMKAPDLIGNFIATMFTYRTPGFQDWREIDVELLGNKPNTVLSNLIVADDQPLWSADIEEPAYDYPFGLAPSGLPAGFNNRTAFHTYAFEWTPHQIRWFVDEHMVRVKQTGIGEDHLPVPELPAKIIMNTWVFPNSDFGGDPSLNQYPFATQYEWFRFYKWNGEVTYPCVGAPGCLDPSDLDYSKNNSEDGITPNP